MGTKEREREREKEKQKGGNDEENSEHADERRGGRAWHSPNAVARDPPRRQQRHGTWISPYAGARSP